jgi:hypothetical protein
MSEGDRADASARLEDVLETADEEIEDIATSGGITADTRGICRSIRCCGLHGGAPSRALPSTATGRTSEGSRDAMAASP